MPRSRRTLLKTAGLTLSGSLSVAAGCLNIPSSRSAGNPDDTPTPSSTTNPAVTEFTQWLPDPTTTPVRDGYGFQYFDIASIRAQQDSIHKNAYSKLEARMLGPVPSTYVDIDDVDAAVNLDHRTTIALGSFDPKTVGTKLTSMSRTSTRSSTRTPTTPTRTPWSEPKHYQGFDLYGTDYVYAISEDALLVVSPLGEVNAVEYTKAVIDAPDAETSQYGDGNEFVAAMLNIVDEPHAVWCYPEAMDGSTSRGFRTDSITGELKSWRFEPETTHFSMATTYSNIETAASGELTAFIESNSDRFGPYDGLDVQTDGRLAWTEGTIPTAEFDHLSAGGPDDGVTTPH